MVIINGLLIIACLAMFLRFVVKLFAIFTGPFSIPDTPLTHSDWLGLLVYGILFVHFGIRTGVSLVSPDALAVVVSPKWIIIAASGLIISVAMLYGQLGLFRRHRRHMFGENPDMTYAKFVEVGGQSIYDLIASNVMLWCFLLMSVTYFIILFTH